MKNSRDDLHAFAANVWIADGPPARDFGIEFTTRMTVVKLSDDSLWVNSPVSVPFGTLKRITESGMGTPLRNALFKLAGVAYPHGGVALDIRLSFTNRNLARRSLEKLLAWDFDKLIVAHGVCIAKEAKPFVERAFRWLRR